MMSSHRIKPWIYILDLDNQMKIASPDYVKQLLGVCEVESRIRHLEDRLNVLEEPLRKEAALTMLKREGGKHTYRWFKYRSGDFVIKLADLEALMREGKLVRSKAGRQVVYSLSHEKT